MKDQKTRMFPENTHGMQESVITSIILTTEFLIFSNDVWAFFVQLLNRIPSAIQLIFFPFYLCCSTFSWAIWCFSRWNFGQMLLRIAIQWVFDAFSQMLMVQKLHSLMTIIRDSFTVR